MKNSDLTATAEGRAELARRARENLTATENRAEELRFFLALLKAVDADEVAALQEEATQ